MDLPEPAQHLGTRVARDRELELSAARAYRDHAGPALLLDPQATQLAVGAIRRPGRDATSPRIDRARDIAETLVVELRDLLEPCGVLVGRRRLQGGFGDGDVGRVVAARAQVLGERAIGFLVPREACERIDERAFVVHEIAGQLVPTRQRIEAVGAIEGIALAERDELLEQRGQARVVGRA